MIDSTHLNYLILDFSDGTYPQPGIFEDSFAGLTEDALLESLGQLHDVSSIDVNDFYLPNLPKPPNSFRGIRRKSSSLKRWLAICSDDLIM